MLCSTKCKKMLPYEITPRTVQVLASALQQLPKEGMSDSECLKNLASLIRIHGDLVKDSDDVQQSEIQTVESLHVSQPFIVFILGGPGSGKGTVCTRLVSEAGFSHLSVGDLLRREVASGSTVGNEVESIMKSGGLVSDELAISIVRGSIESTASRNPGCTLKILLDGFPRTLEQAIMFESNIAQVAKIVWLTCSNQILVDRILKRGLTSGRQDDNLESVTARLKAFNENTERIREHYATLNDGRLHLIDASLESDEVFSQVYQLLR